MARVACLFVPDLPLEAALRAEPELRGRRVVVTDAGVIVSAWLRGRSVAQARAVDPDLVTRPLALEGLRSAQEALLDAALSVTPRVEDAGPGCAYLDLDGTEALFPSARGLLTALETRLAAVGLESVRMGIGTTRAIARLAARAGGGGHVVAPGAARDFLAALPLDLLDPPHEVFDALTRWGVRTLGELVRIPTRALGTRLGEAGVALARRARGEDDRPFRPTPPRLRFEEGADPGHPVSNLEALAFVLRALLDRLAGRLRVRGLAAHALRVELELESGRTFARSVELGAPTLETPVLVSLVRLALERDPPPEPVERVRAIATPGSVDAVQLDLFLPPLPAPAELAVTLARLEALCGSDRIGAPGVADTHHPDPARVERFTSDASIARDGPRPAMALRALRPPRSARVRERDGAPGRVEFEAAAGSVLQLAGPWRLYGEWWGDACFARDYYDVELSSGGVYRLYHNLPDDSWFVDGEYD